MDASETRKEPDPLETATRAAKIAMEAEALQQFQQRVEEVRAAQKSSEEQFQQRAQAQNTSEAASETAARLEALQQFQKHVKEARAAQKASEAASQTAVRLQGQKLSSDKAASLKKTRTPQDAYEAEVLNQRQKLSSNAVNPVRGGFADEVKSLTCN